ncbi:hypothetical protein BD779DRAFT_765770, partial [Infundibulicybe gibba]
SLEDLQDPNSAFITIKVVYLAETQKEPKETYCTIKRNAKFRKFYDAFANRVGKSVGCIRFLHNGKRIYSDVTPAELDVKDGDTIDVCNEHPARSAGLNPREFWNSLTIPIYYGGRMLRTHVSPANAPSFLYDGSRINSLNTPA